MEPNSPWNVRAQLTVVRLVRCYPALYAGSRTQGESGKDEYKREKAISSPADHDDMVVGVKLALPPSACVHRLLLNILFVPPLETYSTTVQTTQGTRLWYLHGLSLY